MKLSDLQDKIKTIRQLEREINSDIQKRDALQESDMTACWVEVVGVMISIPKAQALGMLNAHLLNRSGDLARLCKEIGVEP